MKDTSVTPTERRALLGGRIKKAPQGRVVHIEGFPEDLHRAVRMEAARAGDTYKDTFIRLLEVGLERGEG